ncbi:hypothetical protein QBC44DRAFT_328038 [Cladorrhinum sp. PSN332]|nr:hypothetical protein QBC44DRAFT_328038 [Cladorrhinum sp. PSN332]
MGEAHVGCGLGMECLFLWTAASVFLGGGEVKRRMMIMANAGLGMLEDEEVREAGRLRLRSIYAKGKGCPPVIIRALVVYDPEACRKCVDVVTI